MALAAAGAAQADFAGAGSLASGRYDHAATQLNDGRVLVTGGNNGGPLASAQLYDPKVNGWSSAAPMNFARHGHGAVLLHSGKVLVAGGYAPGADPASPSGYTRTAELYDPQTNTWSRAGNMGTGRFQPTMTELPDGRVLVAGGTGDIESGEGVVEAVALDSAEVYDPATNNFTDVPSMSVARSMATATLLPSGKVLVAGGYDNATGQLSSAELFDPETNTWSDTGALAQARDAATATALRDGDVLVAGGDSGNGALPTAEIYDAGAGTWHAAGSMHHGRQTAAAALLKDGTVLVSGGEDARLGNLLDSVERYDPATDKWTEAGKLPAALKQHTLTALDDGRALVVGGNPGGFDRGVNSAERFSTASATLTDASFGSWIIGAPSDVVKSTLTNTGDRPLTISDVSVAGDDGHAFSIMSNSCLGAPIQPGATCELGLRLTPSAAGPLGALLTLTDDSTAAGSTSASLSGTGLNPAPADSGSGSGGTGTGAGGTDAGGTGSGSAPAGAGGATAGSVPPAGSAASHQGSKGSRGAAARATCKAKTKRINGRKRSTVTCSMTLPTTATVALNARLMNGTKVLASARTKARAGRVKVTLRANRRLRSGRYTLAVARRDGTKVLSQRIRLS